MVNRKKIAGGYQLRHFGKGYQTKKEGLHFLNTFWMSKDAIRLSEKDVIELRDWLSRYINEYYLKSVPPAIPDMKAKTRSIMRGLEQMEAQL